MNFPSSICSVCGAQVPSTESECKECRNQDTLTNSAIPNPELNASGNELTIDGFPAKASVVRPPRSLETVDLTRGSDFGDYELLSEIARGGMGVVFKARHKSLNRIVAIKMIRDGRLSSLEDVQRFHVEAKATAQLDHPGIVPIYEIGEYQGQPFFAMKYIEGGSLSQHLKRFSSDQRSIVEFVIKIADAVQHAHQRGILHRDIKPANILLDEQGTPLLTDLGLAKSTTNESDLTQTGALVGTPSYMAPEQAYPGNTVTTAADIYSTGAILFEMLCGQPPHKADTAFETILKVRNDPIRPLRSLNKAVDADLELICMKCLARDPQSRYNSAGALLSDLQKWLDGEPLSVKPPTLYASLASHARRHRGLAYAILVAVVGIVFSFPLILSLLKMGAGEELYANTTVDPVPAIYRWTAFPKWISAASLIVALLMWPTFGLLVVLSTRPKSIKQAALHGAIVGGVCGLVFFLSIGWFPISRATIITAGGDIKSLTEVLWSGDGATRSELDAALFKKYPLLESIPAAARGEYLRDRIASDSIACGAIVMFVMMGVALLIAISIVGESIVAKRLKDRGQSWWIFVPRYYATWFVATTLLIVVLVVVTGVGQIDGKFFSELPFWTQSILLGVPCILLFLLLRRWRIAHDATT